MHRVERKKERKKEGEKGGLYTRAADPLLRFFLNRIVVIVVIVMKFIVFVHLESLFKKNSLF